MSSPPAAVVFHERQLGGLRCLEAGVGEPIVWLHEAGQLAVGRAHELLAERFRVLAVEEPSAGELERALTAIGMEQFNLLGTRLAATAGLRVAAGAPRRVSALVLESPVTLLPDSGEAELEGRMAQLDLPTLAVFGTLDPAIPPDHGSRYRALMPDCYYVLMYKAGQQVAADRPDAFAALVADFLDRREAFVVGNQPEKLVF